MSAYHHHIQRFLTCATIVVAVSVFHCRTLPAQLEVIPNTVELNSPEASQQLLVSQSKDDQSLDLTRTATYQSLNGNIALVSEIGRVTPVAEGQTEILITHGEVSRKVPIKVSGMKSPIPVSFRDDVVPILSKAGCNSAGCHGKAEGQNGFKLSIFGFDPKADYDALVKEARGRRVFFGAPDQSLLLAKSTGMIPHGGGVKIQPNSLWHKKLKRWIEEGGRFSLEQPAEVVRIRVEPDEFMMREGKSQQLQVTAVFTDGSTRCVTAETEFLCNSLEIAGVDQDGLISLTGVPGEAAVLVRYAGHVAVSRVTIPQALVEFVRPPENNFVDQLVWNKLQRLGIQPSEIADDAIFLRRVYLDTIGTLPDADEVERFLDDKNPDKRQQLISELIDRDEYADFWAMKWADILRVNKDVITPQGSVAMTRWLRKQFAENRPYDQFAKDILTARGNTLAESPASFYKSHNKPEETAKAISQLFLGVRIECAQCHHHPFEKWGQDDYFALSGFFTGVSLSPSASGGEKVVLQAGSALQNPRTGRLIPTAALGAEPVNLSSTLDRRQALAEWMTRRDNPFFARMIANRLWSHYFGRGLCEPIDDMRQTNPATNEPLLNALASHLIELEYDLKKFTATLLNSRVYQLSSAANASNQLDLQNHSHAIWKPVPAEVLLDAICKSTKIDEQFNGWPDGYRAVQIWDNQMPSYFFTVFGRPTRVTVCECERGSEPSISQALHLMNSPETIAKIKHRDGQANLLASSNLSADQIITRLYLCSVSRRPRPAEIELMRTAFEETGTDRRKATEDILWTLLNTREFMYNH